MSEHDRQDETVEPTEQSIADGAAQSAASPQEGALGEPLPEPDDSAAMGETEPEAPAATGPFPDVPITESPLTRRARRARRKRISGITMIALAVVGVVIFGFLGYQAFTNRLEAARKVDSATALIEQADVIVVQVDSVVRSEVTSDLAESAGLAEAQVPEAVEKLARAVKLLEEGRAGNNLDDLRRNELLHNAAAARLEMMQQAPAILRLNRGAAQALAPARQGWDVLVAADSKAVQAVAEYNKLTKSGVRESSALNKQVASELAAARAAFEQAEGLFPEALFEEYIAYVDMRIALNTLSRQSDSAWLRGKVKDANSITSSYNAQDAQAVLKAQSLPESPEKAIADGFTEAAQKPMEAYYKSRDAATDADEALK